MARSWCGSAARCSSSTPECSRRIFPAVKRRRWSFEAACLRRFITTDVRRLPVRINSRRRGDNSHGERIPMKATAKVLVVSVLVIGGLATMPFVVRAFQQRSATPPAKTQKPAKDWPDPATLEQQRRDAEDRKLFKSVEPLAITLTANFKQLQADRNPNSTKLY